MAENEELTELTIDLSKTISDKRNIILNDEEINKIAEEYLISIGVKI